MLRHLERDQRRCTKPVQAKACTRLNPRCAKRSKADHPATEQRRRLEVGELRRNPEGEVGPNAHRVGKPAVAIPSCELGRFTQVLVAPPAVVAATARSAEPRNADPVTALPSHDVVCNGCDTTYRLMARDDRQTVWRERGLRSVANFTRRDAEAFLALAAEVPIQTVVDPYPLADANIALDRLKQGKVDGAAVLTM